MDGHYPRCIAHTNQPSSCMLACRVVGLGLLDMGAHFYVMYILNCRGGGGHTCCSCCAAAHTCAPNSQTGAKWWIAPGIL
jgi:hypothetical protein